MFKKVLVSDDLGSINQGVLSVLDSLGIKNIKQVQYCDDAFLQIEKSILDKDPYDLLITDLSFKADHRAQKYPSGEALIAALKSKHPLFKIIAYSVEDRTQKVRSLMLHHNLNAYVCKGRKGIEELTKALKEVALGNKYISPQVANALSNKLTVEIDDYDVQLLKQLASGKSQEEISSLFKNNNTSPSSLSTIEKRLNKLRIHFKANNAIHLVAIVKDLGLI